MGKQNVLYILADDMGYGDLGRFGDGRAKTPTLDALIAQGAALTHCYSASPVCAPARAALLTGRYPHRTGAVDTYERTGMDRLALDEVTLADVFKSNGYTTGIMGKWHLGGYGAAYHPMRRGFDEFIGIQSGWSHYFRYAYNDNGTLRQSDGGYLTDRISDGAVDFIRRNHESPFFLYVAYNAPHFPFECPEEYVERFRNQGLNERVATIYGMIYCMDQGIGRILSALQECGVEENTIVVFSSDNGPQLGGESMRYNRYLHGEKGESYEGGIRVPAIVRYPGVLQPDTRIHGFFHGCDWFPTLLEACDIPVPPSLKLDGVSRLAAWRQDTPYTVQRCWQWNRFTPVSRCNAAIKDGKWKLVWPAIREAFEFDHSVIDMDEEAKDHPELSIPEITPYDDSGRVIPPPHPPKLFNLEDDPFEMYDLSAELPELVHALTADFERWFQDVEADRQRTLINTVRG